MSKTILNPNSKIFITGMSEVKEAKDGRKYYVLSASQAIDFDGKAIADPFSPIAKRTIWQQFTAKSSEDLDRNDINPEWKSGNPELVAKVIGLPITGQIVTEEVADYVINERTVNKYTTIVFPKETIDNVFKNSGHPLNGETVINMKTDDLTKEEIKALAKKEKGEPMFS